MDPFLAREMLTGSSDGASRGVWRGMAGVAEEEDFSEAINYSAVDRTPVLGHRGGGRETTPARWARTLATYLDNGIGFLALMKIIQYGLVGIAHQLLYSSVPIIGDYLRSLDVGTALILVTLVVFQVLTRDINDASTTYARKPRALFTIFQAYTRLAARLRVHIAIYLERKYRNEDEEDIATDECLDLFHEVYAQIERLTDSSVRLFVEISEGRGMGEAVDRYLARLRVLKGHLLRLEHCGVLSTADRMEITHAVGDGVEDTLENVRFGAYYNPPPFIDNHMRLATVIYLWIMLPALLFVTLGSTMWAFYIVAMFIFDMIIQLRSLIGDPFNLSNSRYQPNNYVQWERDHSAVVREHADAVFQAVQDANSAPLPGAPIEADDF